MRMDGGKFMARSIAHCLLACPPDWFWEKTVFGGQENTMKFTILSVVDRQESESDYETAVDMSLRTM